MTTREEQLRNFVAQHPLTSELTARRAERVVNVLLSRLASVTVVFENIADPHNVSAVMRTAEGLGLDAIHVVEQPNKWEKNKAIAMGSDRWIEVVRHQGLARCLGDLSARGYALWAADVGEGCVPLPELPVDTPVALVFGSEHAGLSKRALSLTDARFTVPMHGFVESFNVSVSAALSLYDVAGRRRRALGAIGDLDAQALERRADLYLERAIRNPQIVQQLRSRST